MSTNVSARPAPPAILGRVRNAGLAMRGRVAALRSRTRGESAPWPVNAVVLAGLVCALTISGLLFVLSASSVKSFDTFGSEYAMFLRQLLFAASGLVAMYVLAHIDYHRLARFRVALVVLAAVCLFAVFLPGLGSTKFGATRWIELGPFSFQPSEFAKLALVISMAALGGSATRDSSDVRSVLVPGLMASLGLASIVVLQKDLATAIIIAVAGLSVLFLAGVRLKEMAIVSGLLGLSGGALAYFEPYRRERLMVLLDPARDPLGDGWNSLQSLVAVQSGGVNGVGAGNVLAKHSFLPNVESDFMFAFIGEQLGLIGTLGVILTLSALAVFGFVTAARASDRFGGLLAAGLTLVVVFQAAVHMSVTLGVGPPTGVPLPFISYGGTSVFMTLAAMGIILNVARQPAARGQGIGEGNPLHEPAAPPRPKVKRRSLRESLGGAVVLSKGAVRSVGRSLVDAEAEEERRTATRGDAHRDVSSSERRRPRPTSAGSGERRPSAGGRMSRDVERPSIAQRPGRIRDPRVSSRRAASDLQVRRSSAPRGSADLRRSFDGPSEPIVDRNRNRTSPSGSVVKAARPSARGAGRPTELDAVPSSGQPKPLSTWQAKLVKAIRPEDGAPNVRRRGR